MHKLVVDLCQEQASVGRAGTRRKKSSRSRRNNSKGVQM